MVIARTDPYYQAVLICGRGVHAVVVLDAFELGRHIAMEVRHTRFVNRNAFGAVEHGVGGDVVGPAGLGGEFVRFVGLVVLLEDLKECGFGGA